MDLCPVLPATGASTWLLVAIAVAFLTVGFVAIRVGRRGAVPVVLLLLAASVLSIDTPRAEAAEPCPSTSTIAPAVAPTTTTTIAPPTTTTIAPPTTTTTIPFDPEVTLTFVPTGNPTFCSLLVGLTGFLPDTAYTVVVANDSDAGPFFGSPWTYPDVMTDGAGAAQITTITYSQMDGLNDVFSATVDGITTGFLPIGC